MNELIEQILSYLRGIWRNRWYAIACTWLVCLIGWGVVLLLPDQYQASARVYVDTQTVLRPVLQGLTVDLNPNAQVELITRTLLSRPNLEKIAQSTGLDRQAKDAEALDGLLTRLSKGIGFAKSGADLYAITYTDPQPELAKKMVQTIVDVFEKNLVGNTQQGTDTALRFLGEQIREYEARLVEAEERLKAFKIKNAGRMPSEGQNYYGRMQQASNDLEAIRLDLAQAENRRAALQQQLGAALQQQAKSDSAAGGETPEAAVVLPVDTRIQALERQLDQLLIQYTDKHPDVNILRKTISDLKKQQAQERAQYTASLPQSRTVISRTPKTYSFIDELRVKLAEEEANIASLQVRSAEYAKRYNELRGQASVLPQVEAELTSLNRDYEINRKKYDELISRRESLRLSEQAEQSKQDVRYRVVEPPRVPPIPSGPKRLLLMSLVLGVGLGAGVGLALLVSQLWPTFDNRRSLMQITNIPVLGSVGVVLSPLALRREHRMVAVYALSVGALFLAYGGLMAWQLFGTRYNFLAG